MHRPTPILCVYSCHARSLSLARAISRTHTHKHKHTRSRALSFSHTPIPRHHGDPLRVQTRISILEYHIYHAFSDLKRPEATPMASASSLQAKAVSKRLQTMLSLPEAVCNRSLAASDAIASGSSFGNDWKRRHRFRKWTLEATGSHPIASGYNVYPAFMIMYASKILYCSHHTHTDERAGGGAWGRPGQLSWECGFQRRKPERDDSGEVAI